MGSENLSQSAEGRHALESVPFTEREVLSSFRETPRLFLELVLKISGLALLFACPALLAWNAEFRLPWTVLAEGAFWVILFSAVLIEQYSILKPAKHVRMPPVAIESLADPFPPNGCLPVAPPDSRNDGDLRTNPADSSCSLLTPGETQVGSQSAKPATDSNALVSIRPYENDDVEELLAAVRESVTELAPWTPWRQTGSAVSDVQAWITKTREDHGRGSAYEFAVVGPRGQLVGGCNVTGISHATIAGVGYWTRTSFTGRGVASSALRQLLHWTFENTNMDVLKLLVPVDNGCARRAAESVGARQVAVGVMTKTFASTVPTQAWVNAATVSPTSSLAEA